MKKRIALAAIAALAGGLLVAAPASAAVATGLPFAITVADTGVDPTTTGATLSGTQIAGASNYVVIAAETNTASGTHAVVTVSGSTVVSADSPAQDTATIGSSSTVVTYANETLTGGTPTNPTIKIATPLQGTITVTVQGVSNSANSAGQYTYTTLQTITFSVGASAVTGTIAAAKSSAAMTVPSPQNATLSTLSSDSLTATAKSTAQTVNTPAATIVYTLKDANGNLVGSAATATVSISGPGVLVNGTTVGRLFTATGNIDTVTVLSDGTSGVATITFTAGAFTATRTVVFYGAVATVSASPVLYSVNGDTTTAQNAIAVVAKDANGIVVPSQALTITSSNTAVASAAGASAAPATVGTATVAVTAVGGVYGNVTFTIKDTNTGIAAAPVTIAVAKNAIASFSVTSDTATYLPGAKVTLTYKAMDINGLPVPDGSYSLAVASNLAINGLSSTQSVSLVNGTATQTLYAPATSGSYVSSFKVSSPIDSSIAAGSITSVVSFAVTDSAAAAAAAATAKATADAIAALQTSVGSLTTTVAALVASMTAQIKVINATLKTLAAAIAKIKKKVRA